jgi:hypothetical protein
MHHVRPRITFVLYTVSHGRQPGSKSVSTRPRRSKRLMGSGVGTDTTGPG